MIRDVGETIGRAVLDGIGRAASRVQESKPLPADLLESDDAYLAVFDAAGASAEDVQVRFEDDTLQVSIERFRPFHEDYEMRFPGRGLALDGAVTFPGDVEVAADAADATLKNNGTLEVLVPKADASEDSGVDDEVDANAGADDTPDASTDA